MTLIKEKVSIITARRKIEIAVSLGNLPVWPTINGYSFARTERRWNVQDSNSRVLSAELSSFTVDLTFPVCMREITSYLLCFLLIVLPQQVLIQWFVSRYLYRP